LPYLQRQATATGFTTLATDKLAARQENGAPITAHTVLLGKPL